MSSTPVELRLPPDAQYVGLARLVVTAAARQAGMAGDRVEDLKIAVSEATTNAITGHNRRALDGPIVVSFGPTGAGTFEVTIADTGSDVEPEPSADTDAPDPGVDGELGVTLIRGLADAVDFRREGGTAVHIRFSVNLDGDDPGHRTADGDESRTV